MNLGFRVFYDLDVFLRSRMLKVYCSLNINRNRFCVTVLKHSHKIYICTNYHHQSMIAIAEHIQLEEPRVLRWGKFNKLLIVLPGQ